MVAIKPDDVRKFELPEFLTIYAWNSAWYGTMFQEYINLSQLEMPEEDSPNTKLLDLDPVPVASM